MQASESECSKGQVSEQGCGNMEQNILSRIISRIYDLKLITEIEKQNIVEKATPLELKGELFDLLSKKDATTASQIQKIIRMFNFSNEALQQEGANDNNEPLRIEPRNPMKIDIILKAAFSFLNLNDIKNCRLVCKKWDNVAEPFVRRLSKIVFIRTSQNNHKNTDRIGFNETFQDCGTAVPFTSFSFRSLNGERDGWTITEITNFFEQHGRNVKELEFHNLVLIYDLNDRFQIHDYDVSPWISGLPIEKLVIDCLQCMNFYVYGTKLTVNLSQLHGVKKLCLKNVNVNCELGAIISLSELELEDVTFHREGLELNPCHINDYVDFKDTKKVIIIHDEEEEPATILDMKDFTNVDEFNLRNCKIVNWEISQCRVKKMELARIPLSEKTGMEIEELHFRDSSIDLVALPLQIEKLKFSNWYRHTEISCSQPINLLKLSSLYLQIRSTDDLRALSDFRNCPRLVDIQIRTIGSERTKLNLDWIPTSIKRLKLEGNICIDFRNRPLQLDTLVLEESTFANAALIVNYSIRPQNLVMSCHGGLDWTDASVLVYTNSSFNLYVGPLHGKNNSCARCIFAKNVDREANYYLFRRTHFGKAIDFNKFNSRNFNL